MWNSGNMQTVPPPPGLRRRARGSVRRQLTRCESTTPFGPAGAAAGEEDDVRIALVETVDGQRRVSTRRPQAARSATNGTPTARRRASAPATCDSAGQQQRRPRVLARPASPRPRDDRAFSGANTPPILASAANTGTASSDVSPHHKHPVAAADARRRAAPWRSGSPRVSISPNVSAPSSSVAATASGATRAAFSRIAADEEHRSEPRAPHELSPPPELLIDNDCC